MQTFVIILKIQIVKNTSSKMNYLLSVSQIKGAYSPVNHEIIQTHEIIHTVSPFQGFYCHSEAEFEDLCLSIQKFILSERTPLFELQHHRPPHWPPFEPYTPQSGPSLAGKHTQ